MQHAWQHDADSEPFHQAWALTTLCFSPDARLLVALWLLFLNRVHFHHSGQEPGGGPCKPGESSQHSRHGLTCSCLLRR